MLILRNDYLFAQYNKEIHLYPLLTPEREVELSDIILKSSDFDDVYKSMFLVVLKELPRRLTSEDANFIKNNLFRGVTWLNERLSAKEEKVLKWMSKINGSDA